MEPELKPSDELIVKPDTMRKPGNFVLVKSDDNPEVIIRRYKQLSISKSTQQFELLATNKNWPNIQSHEARNKPFRSNMFLMAWIAWCNR